MMFAYDLVIIWENYLFFEKKKSKEIPEETPRNSHSGVLFLSYA